MDKDSTTEQQLTRSINCSKLPEVLQDKQAAKAYFSKFGAIKGFVMRPKRNECTVEYETVNGALAALNYQGSLNIFPTPPSPAKSETPEPIDPDVQSELELMMPSASGRPQPKTIDSVMIRNPQSVLKPRMPPAIRPSKIEPLTVQVDPRLLSIARNELENLAKKPACTFEERLQILDARDKLYRLVNAKTTDINKATSTKGTCKDMCPEKERIMREARMQVASFEVSDNDSSMSQKKAIKQYSRSAADAETPLPHELRPETSLKTSMTYLLHKIMNLCDDDNISIGDWFHFVWDRTRGIRKDITQQELCSPITVELVEQCVRFHIHCAARFVAEDPSIFDQRINTENVTKCLQTLKYMYNDLKPKQVLCPNEAEFRAYVVLLNLNESGNFLWEIKQLEKNILNSEEIRFALDVYFAIANNNYVKFFKLVRRASYMAACLLLRYFTQVRIAAIKTITRSYTPKRSGFNYNLSYLTEILAFEDQEQTMNFLSQHGLMCDADTDLVFLDRKMFGLPETAYQMERAHQLVESKMVSTVAEAVCGGPLPSPACFLNLVPHSSFDNEGFLKREAFLAEDQNGPSPVSAKDNVFKIPKVSPPVSPMTQQRFQRNDQPDGTMAENVFYKPSASSPFAKVSPAAFKNVFKSNTQIDGRAANPFASKTLFGSSNQAASSIFGGQNAITNPFATPAVPTFEVPSANTFGMPKISPQAPAKSANHIFGAPAFGSQTIFPEQNLSNLQNRQPQPSVEFSFAAVAQQEAELKKKAADMIEKKRQEDERIAKEKADQEELLRLEMEKKRLEEELREEEKFRKLEEERRLQIIAEKEEALQLNCEAILEALTDEVVAEGVRKEAQQSVSLYVKLPEEFYDALEFDIVVDRIYSIYQQEFLAYVNETKMKYELLQSCFNQWRGITRQEIVRREKLSTIGCSILNASLEDQAERLHHPEQRAALQNMKQYLSGSPQAISVPKMKEITMINLFEEIKMKAVETRGKIYWKLLFSIPYKNEEKCLGFSSFINKWLMKSFGYEDKEIFFIDEKIVKSSARRIGICLRKLQGAELLNEKGKKSTDITEHSNGVVFIMNSTDLPTSRKRLQNILEKLDLPAPVSIIVYKNQVASNDEAEIGRFFDLSFEPKVSTFEINLYYECHEKEKNLNQVVIDSCQFLNDCYIEHITNKNFQLFDLQMQNITDFFQLTIGDEMWKRVELSCREKKEFRENMTSFNNVVELYNKCIDKLMEMLTNNFSKLPSISSEFRSGLLPIDNKIPNNYEYFPEDWKSMEIQRQQIAFIHDLKLVTMPDDNFKNFDDFRLKLMTFLTFNMMTHKDKVFQAVVSKVIEFLYSANLVEDEEVEEGISKFCWLSILGEIIVGRFNEAYQKNPQVTPTIIYHRRELNRYKSVPWWHSIEFQASTRSGEPQKKKPRLEIPTNEEVKNIIAKSLSSLNKLNIKIDNFKEISGKTREASKDFDKHLYNFESRFHGKLKAWEHKYKE